MRQAGSAEISSDLNSKMLNFHQLLNMFRKLSINLQRNHAIAIAIHLSYKKIMKRHDLSNRHNLLKN